MDDLIVKFFQQDLDEAEEKALSERLFASTEDALRFGQHAETAYTHYGLPEPKWQGDAPPSAGPRWKHWMWFGLVLVGVVLGFLWRHAAEPARALSGASVSPALKDPVGSPAAALEKPSSGHPTKSAAPEEDGTNPAGVAGARTLSTVAAGLPEMKPVLTPVDLLAQPHHSHTNLSVVLRQSRPGPVVLRVLDPQGTQVVLLYDGLLQPGNWSFDWDGKLADGQKPAPGNYRILVESGAVTQSKKIRIH